MTEQEQKEVKYNKQFGDLDLYRKILVGKTVKEVRFADYADEGLLLISDSGYSVNIGFSACEGSIIILKPRSK